MALETFNATVNNAYLQRHLLAVNPQTLEEAVLAGGEFLSVRPASNPGIRAVLEEKEEAPEVQKVQSAEVAEPSQMEAVLKALQSLTQEVSLLKNQASQGNQRTRDQERESKAGIC